MNRRTFLQSISGGLTFAAIENMSHGYGSAETERKRLGIAKFSYSIRLRVERSGKVKGRLADPLKVPCLTEKYWATFENVPGSDLARTLRYVRVNASPKRLPKVNHLPLNQLIELEEDNIKECLVFAKNRLDL